MPISSFSITISVDGYITCTPQFVSILFSTFISLDHTCASQIRDMQTCMQVLRTISPTDVSTIFDICSPFTQSQKEFMAGGLSKAEEVAGTKPGFHCFCPYSSQPCAYAPNKPLPKPPPGSKPLLLRSQKQLAHMLGRINK